LILLLLMRSANNYLAVLGKLQPPLPAQPQPLPHLPQPQSAAKAAPAANTVTAAPTKAALKTFL
jgi:hypothetical protein